MRNAYRAEDLTAVGATVDHVIPDLMVSPLRRTAAAFGNRRGTELAGGHSAPTLKLYEPTGETGTVEGAATPGVPTIYVSAKMSPAQTAGVAAHEASHVQGITDESECREIQRRVAAEWLQHRYKQRDALAARFMAQREKWLSMPASPARVELACSWMGVQPFQGKLACEELDLRIAELEDLDRIPAGPTGPTAHLQIRTAKPPAPKYSFQMAGRC